MPVTEPVLVIAFNRPDHLAVLLQRLREVGVSNLFVAIDGARKGRVGEDSKVAECQALVNAIDWPCDVQTLFQESNLGCGLGVSTAITWFFTHVEHGIILEDDVIPDPTLFPFCSELLERYAHDSRVFAISGCNFVPTDAQSWPQEPYRFTDFVHVWGWATWRRSWNRHALDIRDWRRRLPLPTLLRRSGYRPATTLYWATNLELTARGAIDTWDYQLALASLEQGSLVATSNINLVENIGFDAAATHTTIGSSGLQPVGHAMLPVADVPVRMDVKAAQWTMRHHCKATTVGAWDRLRRYAMSRRNA